MQAEQATLYFSVPEAACAWCDAPFTILVEADFDERGLPYHAEFPALQRCAVVLAEALADGSLSGGIDPDTELPMERQRIARSELKTWLAAHFPEARPWALYPSAGPPDAELARALAECKQQVAELEHMLTSPGPGTAAGTATVAVAPTPAATLLDINTVAARVGLKRSAIYARVKLGQFPAPMKLSGKASRWRSDEVDAWIEAQKA